MSASHVLILAAFILLGGAGLAAIQESFALCLQALFPSRKSKAHAYRASRYVAKNLVHNRP